MVGLSVSVRKEQNCTPQEMVVTDMGLNKDDKIKHK